MLDELTTVDDSSSGKVKGVLSFQDAYDLFCGAFEPKLAIPDRTISEMNCSPQK